MISGIIENYAALSLEAARRESQLRQEDTAERPRAEESHSATKEAPGH